MFIDVLNFFMHTHVHLRHYQTKFIKSVYTQGTVCKQILLSRLHACKYFKPNYKYHVIEVFCHVVVILGCMVPVRQFKG